MAKDKKPIKSKAEVFYTRAKSLRLMSAGADLDTTFVNDKGMTLNRYSDHPNSHVRTRCWVLQGRPLPEGMDEQNKFLLSLLADGNSKAQLTQEFVAGLRLKFLKESPVVEVPVVEEVIISEEVVSV